MTTTKTPYGIRLIFRVMMRMVIAFLLSVPIIVLGAYLIFASTADASNIPIPSLVAFTSRFTA